MGRAATAGRVASRISSLVVHTDVDCFKDINDGYGHDAGDLVLRKFAELLKTFTRASDISGRMGGDEFLLC